MRQIVAYQLSLLGDAPKPGRAWSRPWFTWNFCGMRFPLDEKALHQYRLLTPDSHKFDAPSKERAA